MKITTFALNALLLLSGLHTSVVWSESGLNSESDAMQITTHLNNLTGIACDSSGQTCLAVGIELRADPDSYHYLVYKTYNGGITWSEGAPLTPPENVNKKNTEESFGNLMSIRCDISGQNCIIAGTETSEDSSLIYTYTTHDAGQSWSLPNKFSAFNANTETELADEFPSLRLKCEPQAHSCMLATNILQKNQTKPIIFTTNDGGETWSSGMMLSIPMNTPEGVLLDDVACDQSGLFCTATTHAADTNTEYVNQAHTYSADTTFIYSTHDGGLTWSDAKPLVLAPVQNQEIPSPQHHQLGALSCDQSGLSCIALGTFYDVKQTENSSTILSNNAHTYLTKNGGSSWSDTSEILSSDPNFSIKFTALHCDITNRFCTAVGIEFNQTEDNNEFKPIIYTTIDGGQTWLRKAFTAPDRAFSVLTDVFCSEDAALCHAVGLQLNEDEL